ncbi:lytic murein transglycosylase B [Paraburkholderia bonniea]|uniref:lytic murein transglycosylase B n=1 Tax=Paraburkholderia bonniea TaxID=2152891 RepID=UPI0012927C06|nr:lytic murein transglycosylase B [Paraburkholderia bonniea]WJF91006.1 lytic murein transglycosylase B [Paraburkholderia bonniea]WJF94320.1 lytic murein transglycosylase B [Paraburkholderia bonniea]
MTVQLAPSARNRLRTQACAIALSLASAMFVAATPAVAQSQPQTAAAQGQTFEEEIVPQRYTNNSQVDAFINDMAARYDFDPAALHALFSRVSYSATAVKLVTPSPSPSIKNWRTYQARFLDQVRINAGVKFWRNNQATLQRAYQEFGVPPEVIVGIIGVETIYGRYMGNFRVLDALTTLSFDYPNTPNRADRQALFRKNLEDYLVWTRDAQIDPSTVLGSYTGAIGIPQFLPSSIVQYAVNYDGNPHIDLRSSQADAIGSVANYLKQNGWETGRPVVWNISPDAGSQGIAQAAADGKPEPRWSLQQLLNAGMAVTEPGLDVAAEAGTPLTVVDLPSPARPTEYVLGLRNFYVLTRYNRSFFYALAVYQLGEKIRQQMQATSVPGMDGSAPDALLQ